MQGFLRTGVGKLTILDGTVLPRHCPGQARTEMRNYGTCAEQK